MNDATKPADNDGHQRRISIIESQRDFSIAISLRLSNFGVHVRSLFTRRRLAVRPVTVDRLASATGQIIVIATSVNMQPLNVYDFKHVLAFITVAVIVQSSDCVQACLHGFDWLIHNTIHTQRE